MQRIGSALVISLVGSSASADAPPVDRVVVDTVTVNGSGCPAGTAAVAVSPDNTAFTISYSSYIAQVGVGASPTDFRKNCNLNLFVHVPPGFTYAIAASSGTRSLTDAPLLDSCGSLIRTIRAGSGSASGNGPGRLRPRTTVASSR